MTTLRDNIEQNLPFISVITYGGNEYIGIIINQDQYVTSFYDLNAIRTAQEKELFIEIGEVWWWESNRSIPINIFLRGEWDKFRIVLRTFSNKDLEIIHGPVCSLTDISRKKSKRKSITLVRRLE